MTTTSEQKEIAEKKGMVRALFRNEQIAIGPFSFSDSSELLIVTPTGIDSMIFTSGLITIVQICEREGIILFIDCDGLNFGFF